MSDLLSKQAPVGTPRRTIKVDEDLFAMIRGTGSTNIESLRILAEEYYRRTLSWDDVSRLRNELVSEYGFRYDSTRRTLKYSPPKRKSWD